jgi:hypothetical protein
LINKYENRVDIIVNKQKNLNNNTLKSSLSLTIDETWNKPKQVIANIIPVNRLLTYFLSQFKP